MSTTLEHGSGHRLRFGPFELRPAERLLHCDGVRVPVGSRAMDVLLCLLDRPGCVVGPEELLASVWRGVNVDPTALRVQVSALRKALAAADPGAVGYISNVAGRGYCFVAPILRLANDGSAASRPVAVDRPALPAAPRRMIGRDALIETLERTVATERLVTLVGPGGIGKTTVALAMAHRLSPAFEGEVAFVDLATQKGDDSVAPLVATALGLTGLEDHPIAEVAAQLRSRRLLLILDSCEHVIGGAAALAEAIRQAAPQCHILATSREPLNAGGEQVRRLEALEMPPPNASSFAAVCSYPAAQLFVERAAAGGVAIERREPEAALVADICRKLDGIPLAIELAAGRVDAFGLATTHALLDSRLQLTWTGLRTAPPRQVTLSATLDWSYDLLSAEEAALLRALSIFVSWFSMDAAETVTDSSLRAHVTNAIAGLVTKSLVSADRAHSPVRYRLLDTTRDYARLKLESSGELTATAARHAAWVLSTLANQPVPHTERWERWEWTAFFNNHIQDAQSALDWSLSENGDRSLAVPLTVVCSPVWGQLYRNGHESRRRIEAALSIVEPDSRDEMLLNEALSYALMDLAPYDMHGAEIAAARMFELAERFDDLPYQQEARWCLWNTHILTRPNIPKAQELALAFRAHAARLDRPGAKVMAELMVGISELVGGNLAAARAAGDRAEALGATKTSYPNTPRVSVLWLVGMPDSAAAAAQVNLERARAIRSVVQEAAVLTDACGALAVCVGDWTGAARYADLIDASVAHGAFTGYRIWARILRATIAARRGDSGPGRMFLTAALQTECGHPRFASVLTELALRLGAAGAEDIARDLADRLLQRIEATGERWIWSEVQRVRGELSRDPVEAEALFEAALAVAQEQGARAWALRAATSLARRRRSAAEQVLKPLLASFTEGAGTQDIVEARAVLSAYGLDP